jgi:hypothetical protein
MSYKHQGGRGSEIVVRKSRVYVNGMLWENGYLSSRVNVNLLQSGVSKLACEMAMI